MSETLTQRSRDHQRAVRVDYLMGPPQEVSSNEWWCAAAEFIRAIILENLDLYEELGLVRPYVNSYERSIRFSAYGLRELRAHMAMVPQPKEWEKDTDGQPQMKATVNGWNLILVRNDLTCDLVETGEVEEIEVEEVVEPAKKRTVKKQVPVTVRECPSMLAE